MKINDTSSQTQKLQVEIYQRMSPAEKIRRIFSVYKTGRTIAMAGLKERYPQADNSKIWYLWAKQHLGEKLFRQIYGEIFDE